MKDKKQILYDYWNKSQIGREMIASPDITNADLLFLIPNNKKRMLGLPLTRVAQRGRKKKEYKKKRKQYILNYKMFSIIQKLAYEELKKNLLSEKYFNQFVEVKDLSCSDYIPVCNPGDINV